MQRQEQAPLWEALLSYVRAGYTKFHVPGHKGGRGAPPELGAAWGRSLLEFDLTELPGLDNLHAPAGAIRVAQELAAELYGADASFFLVGGTSAGLIAAVLAATRPGMRLILPRHAHRSLLAAVILGDLEPVFYPVYVDKEWLLPGGWDEEAAEMLIRRTRGAGAVVLVHPTYHGLIGRAQELTAAAHAASLTVIADEAHGPHFYLHPDLPSGALTFGADLAAQSAHKLLGSLTQSSWLHLAGGRVAASQVQEVLRWLESSSPSYLLMASLDLTRRQAALTGRSAWGRTLELAERVRAEIGRLTGITCLDATSWPGVTAQDPCKLTLKVSDLGLTGVEAAAYLRQAHGIQVEMADLCTILLVLTPADDEETAKRLLAALSSLVRGRHGAKGRVWDLPALPPPVQRLRPREAAFTRQVSVPWRAARGRVAARTLVPYPPGVPLLWPGEEVTAEVLEVAEAYRHAGVELQGVTEGEREEPLLVVVEE
ncbi:MAG: hypothetical protein PWP58_91 [Bacillota bacterium]|nr:hypothetical protein [Bacillota bacterium]